MSGTWEYNAGWVGYNEDQTIALKDFRELLVKLGSQGWELVNFQVVTWGSGGFGEGTSQGTFNDTSEATSWEQNTYKVFVKAWKSRGGSSQNFSHTFNQTHRYNVWYVFKRLNERTP